MISHEPIGIRECTESDSYHLAQFYNKYQYGPVRYGYPLTEKDIKQLFQERKINLYLAAEYKGDIIGTLLFSNLSSQRAAEPDAAWAGYFLIHPEFRSGSIPDKFFTYAIRKLIQQGIRYIDTEVNPEDKLAMSLYKRVGLYQTSRSYINYDGYLNLRSYLPYLIRYFVEAFQPPDREALVSRGWKTIKPVQSMRNLNSNAIVENGIETVKYSIDLGSREANGWIDVKSQKMTKVQTKHVFFTSYIKEGNNLAAGQEVHVHYVFQHHFKEAVTADISAFLGQQAISETTQSFDPDQLYEWEDVVQLTDTFDGELVTTLKTKDFQLELFFGVTIKASLEVYVKEAPKLVSGKETVYPVIVKNNSGESLIYRLQVQSDNPEVLEAAVLKPVEEFVVESGAKVTHELQLNARKNGVANLLISAAGRQHNDSDTVSIPVPVHTYGHCNSYEDEQHLILESMYLSAKVNKKTGCLYLYDFKTGQQLAQEAWPDLDYPFCNAVKEPKLNDLTWGKDSEDRIHIFHRRTGLKRHISFFSEKTLKIEDDAESGERIKIYPWCMLYAAQMTVPLKTQDIKFPMIYGEKPFSLHDFEYVDGFDLPAQSEEYRMNYTVFEDQNVTLGMMWEGAVERVLYGLRWMPALVFTKGPNDKYISKTHYYTVEEKVGEVYANIVESKNVLAPFAGPDVVRADEKIITTKEEQHYIIQNNRFAIKIGKQQGAITYVAYQGKEIGKAKPALEGCFFLPGFMIPDNIPYSFNDKGLVFQSMAEHPRVKDVQTADKYVNGHVLKLLSCDMGAWQVEYLASYHLPVLQVNMKKNKDDKHFVFHFFWGRQGKSSIKKMYGWQNGKQLVILPKNQNRKIYADSKMTIEFVNGLFVTIFVTSANTKMAVYEWFKKGIQVGLFTCEEGENLQFHFVVGETMQESLSFSQMLLEELEESHDE
ncbi:GNAT family N-acetyltransferase [Paenibacillus melissococcoides]|uniref:GNAT family N-acetyltransferase n=1 Tax=Paenibacillus melissococcoides TaxID=2912268 RepID=A0ABN8UB27_9BACL|nr:MULTISPECIES: GNAT family N-acetyltransferase [Paenibacillus]MEB9892484.1 GNAT family N-acetyltransferase [Bacillus cereus]CAH8248284.1 GNAT family N-acetyltransferase [Paenibacillus melissococcoides]CAH8717942.1 GNAT family N-acetyltransferase [Paenibacillus melissococcoides]CAH8719180.1 GNAT family N-acetyltransferase [Paenibacillus melissococcoides]GIO78636.1 hypothetical protein J6TS7_22460 [Paenibacillus dendritiformis]